jgi:hypothetical protein
MNLSIGRPVILTNDIQYSAHVPTAFIRANLPLLLPSWTMPVASVLLVLQRPQVFLINHSLATEADKDRLRLQFIRLANAIANQLAIAGHQVDVFDPRTGLPMRSAPGPLPLDDVAVVHSLLGYDISDVGGCWGVIHPRWGQAVYPSTLLSSATPAQLEAIAHQVLRASL